MAIKLRELKIEARSLAQAGQFDAALAVHDHMLAQNPLDSDSRRKIADLLLRLGDQAGAVEVYRAVAMHDLRSGRPLSALVAFKVLESLEQRADELIRLMATSYAHGAPALAKFAARQAPVDLDAEIAPVDPSDLPSGGADLATLSRRARARALDLSVFVQYPEQYLPVPFFSELPPSLFPKAVQMLRLIRGSDGDLVIREGEPGRAFYFVASGTVRVFGKTGGKIVERTQLHEGALFGEMALYTEQPRTASIGVVGEADLLEIDREAVQRLCTEVPGLADRIEKFARERVLRTLLATSPLFKPFDQKQQMDLLGRFEGHEVAPGTVLIREGDAGKGLFVILLGDVEVFRTDADGREQPVARLSSGELFGEMALLGEPVTTASVRAISPTTILFLGRDYFRRLVDALPTLRQYFEALAQQRRKANT